MSENKRILKSSVSAEERLVKLEKEMIAYKYKMRIALEAINEISDIKEELNILTRRVRTGFYRNVFDLL